MQSIARFDGDGTFSIFATTYDDTDIAVYLETDAQNRRCKIDNQNASLADLSKILRIVWLTPKEDRVFIDSASDRRNFFDHLVSSFDPIHTGRIAKLSKLLSERSNILKTCNDINWLDTIDKQISSTSIAIAASRIQYASEINYFFNTGAISVNGFVENLLLNNSSTDAETLYYDYLTQNRELIGDKMVIEGVNKSDFGVFNKTLNLPANITSTGQQKAILTNLILSHAKLIHVKTGKKPIILLDEAAAHLDKEACKKLFVELNESEAQVWATGTNIETFKDIPNSIFVTCQNGAISNIVMSENINEEN